MSNKGNIYEKSAPRMTVGGAFSMGKLPCLHSLSITHFVANLLDISSCCVLSTKAK